MALIKIDRNPPAAHLKSFGIMLVLFVALIGALSWWRNGTSDGAVRIWAIGGALAAAYWAVPALRRPVYVGWMYAAFPIGWTVSHLLIATIYYLVVTPIALAARATGYDPLRLRFDRSAPTYWVRHTGGRDPRRYFRQF